MVNTVIDIAACVGTDVLLGRPMGEEHFPLLLAAILRFPEETVVALNFGGITNITASYIAATIARLLKLISAGSLGRYLLITNVHTNYEREIAYVLSHENAPALLRKRGGEHILIGPLDHAYARTLDMVTSRGKATAKELQATSKERIGQTGWVKRLTTLHQLGLIKRTKIGREYAYEPLHTEVTRWEKTF